MSLCYLEKITVNVSFLKDPQEQSLKIKEITKTRISERKILHISLHLIVKWWTEQPKTCFYSKKIIREEYAVCEIYTYTLTHSMVVPEDVLGCCFQNTRYALCENWRAVITFLKIKMWRVLHFSSGCTLVTQPVVSSCKRLWKELMVGSDVSGQNKMSSRLR